MAYVEYEEKGDHIVVVRLNRPERMNAFWTETMTGMAESWKRFAEDDNAWVGIITGTGRAFSAGMDIKARVASGEKGLGLPTIPLRDLFQAEELDKPTIAAVNGFAFGIGFFTAMRADLCIAAESATFQISEIQRGSAAGSNFGYQFGLTRAAARELAFGGTLTARRAYDIGLVNQVVPDAQLMDAAIAKAREIAALPPLAIRGNIKLVRALTPSIPAGWNVVSKQVRDQISNSEDSQEAIRAFAEKRKPVFRMR